MSVHRSGGAGRGIGSSAAARRSPASARLDGVTPSTRRWIDPRGAIARARESKSGAVTTLATVDESLQSSCVGPLADLPVVVKDMIAVQGFPLGAGSAVRTDAPVERQSAAIVTQFATAGATVIGLANLHEFGFGATGVNLHTGTPANPRMPGCIPGGSSSGSAVAVAEGIVPVAIGTDTGGSVRIPAACCGVVGFKPAYGSYPTEGLFPLAPSLDHIGLLAANVATIAQVHVGLGNEKPLVASPLRIGIPVSDGHSADIQIADSVRDALNRLALDGCQVDEVPWPTTDRTLRLHTAIMFAEAAATHRESLLGRRHLYGTDVRRRLEAGLGIDAVTYVDAQRERATIGLEVAKVLARFDAVITPTVPIAVPAMPIDSNSRLDAQLVRNTHIANLIGVPALSLPIEKEGQPVGLQLVAHSNALLLGVAEYVESVLG